MEYGAVIILVAALLATVGFVVVPERVRSGTLSAICQLFGGEGCGDVKGVAATQPKADPSPGVTYGPPVPVDPNAPVDPVTEGLDPTDPDVQRYNNAKTENTNADRAVTDAQAGADEVLKQLKDFLLDVVGWTDLQKCVSSGDVVACISTLINIVPWGKVFKLLKKIPGAIKLAKRLKEIWEILSGAKKRKEAAEKALKEADDILQKKPKKPVVCKRPSSFLPGTLVLLADGSHRPIEDVQLGDTVWATDPETGVSGPRRVTRLISSQGVKQLVDITIGNRWLGQHTITATGPHPFWSLYKGAWVEAGKLNTNDRLAQPDRQPVSLSSIYDRMGPQRVHNLTVEGLHTYYVIAGATPVLVHNADPDPLGCGPLDGREEVDVVDPVTKNIITDIDKIENGTLWELKSAFFGDAAWLAKQVDAKLAKYLKARPHLEGYENAPIGFRFTSDKMDPRFRATLEEHFRKLREQNPGLDLRLEFVG